MPGIAFGRNYKKVVTLFLSSILLLTIDNKEKREYYKNIRKNGTDKECDYVKKSKKMIEVIAELITAVAALITSITTLLSVLLR